MNCKYFGECGACNFYEYDYNEALIKKRDKLMQMLEPYYKDEIELFDSPRANHRARAEFKVWHIDSKCHLAMSNLEKNGITIIDNCPKVIEAIESLIEPLMEYINGSTTLKNKLFSIEFLSGKSGEVLVTMIYHKKLDTKWEDEAKDLEQKLNISIIGRARKQKIVLSKEYITEILNIDGKEYKYRYYEGGFTQPNPYINEKMIGWASRNLSSNRGDFLECYCGLGNFTIPLSKYFDKVLATEISKNSIKAAIENCKLNGVDNIDFIRLNAAETAEAISGVREFRRLKGIDLDSFNFSATLVDPPRAGLDEASLNLAKSIDKVIYISCNPSTLAQNLKELTKTHKVKKAALFDQFPYTTHIESGVVLERF